MKSDLTPKQRAFVDGVLSGLSYRDAYIKAGYSSNMKAGNVSHEASKLARHPKIAPLLEAGQKKATERAIEAATWSREVAIGRLEAINERAYKQLLTQGTIARDSLSAFFGSLDRLNELTGVNETETQVHAPVFYFDPKEAVQVISTGVSKIIDDIS